MVIESMDDDTETRRLSPVAVLSGGYVDLLNGPQDHGWCNGYACLDRLSTFITLVKPGKYVALYQKCFSLFYDPEKAFTNIVGKTGDETKLFIFDNIEYWELLPINPFPNRTTEYSGFHFIATLIIGIFGYLQHFV